MADPASIMARIRQHGANVTIDGGRLKIVNGKKLPAGALDFIKANGKAIADWLEHEGEFEERAAIIEHDGGAPRAMAEAFAKTCIAAKPSNWSEVDHGWFIGKCAQIIDEAATLDRDLRRAA